MDTLKPALNNSKMINLPNGRRIKLTVKAGIKSKLSIKAVILDEDKKVAYKSDYVHGHVEED